MNKEYCGFCKYFMETIDREICLKYCKDLHNIDHCQNGRVEE